MSNPDIRAALERLAPCPFCGSEASLEDERLQWVVRCSSCCACVLGDRAPEPEQELPESYWAPFRQSAVDRWNCRPGSMAESPPNIRAALERLVEIDDANSINGADPDMTAWDDAFATARAALAAEPVGEGPSDEELLAMRSWSSHGHTFDSDLVDFARAVLARWGTPTAPPAPEPGEVGELVKWLKTHAEDCHELGRDDWAVQSIRAATLLQQQAAPAPVAVPVAVADALIKCECALSDVAEGEPERDEGDPAQWAEQRCAETLAIIRPVMKLHRIRTSEWPPQPLPQVGEGEGPNA